MSQETGKLKSSSESGLTPIPPWSTSSSQAHVSGSVPPRTASSAKDQMLKYEPVDTAHIQMLTMARVWLLLSLCGGGCSNGFRCVAHTWACIWRPSHNFWCHFLRFYISSIETQSFTESWSSPGRLGRLASEPQGFPVSTSPVLRLNVYATTLCFHMNSGHIPSPTADCSLISVYYDSVMGTYGLVFFVSHRHTFYPSAQPNGWFYSYFCVRCFRYGTHFGNVILNTSSLWSLGRMKSIV